MTEVLPFAAAAAPKIVRPDLGILWRRVMQGIRVPLRDVLRPADMDRRARLALDLISWIQWYFPDLRELTQFQARFTRQLQDLLLFGPPAHNRKAFAAPRGGGKTTIAMLAILWAAVNGHVRYVYILTASGPRAAEHILGTKAKLLGNDRLHADYPELTTPIRATGGDSHRTDSMYPLRQDEMRLHNGVWIAAHGLDSAIAGALKDDLRPDALIFDDVEAELTLGSEAELNALRRRFEVACGMPDQQSRALLLWICTINQQGGLSDELTDAVNNPAWRGERIAALTKLPDRMDLWNAFMGILRPLLFEARIENTDGASPDTVTASALAELLDTSEDRLQHIEPETARAYRFYLANRAAMDAGAEVSSKLLPIWKIYEQRAVYGERFFRCELQQDPPPPEEAKTLDEHALDKRRIMGPTYRDASGREIQRAPDWVYCFLATIDMGKHSVHFEVDGWDETFQTSVVIDAGIVHTQVDVDQQYRNADESRRITLLQHAIRTTLTRLYTRFNEGYPNILGEVLPVRWVGIDCGGQTDGYAWMNDVLSFCVQTRNRWIPLKGAGWTDAMAMKTGGLHYRRQPASVNPYGRIDVDADFYKTMCSEALEKPLWADKTQSEPYLGTRQFAARLEAAYLKHQTAEQKNAMGHWGPSSGHGDSSHPTRKNHWWDTAYNQFVLADLARRWKHVQESALVSAPGAPSSTTAATRRKYE